MPSKKLPSVLSLTFNGQTVQLNPDEHGRYNLNVLRKAAGNQRRHEVRNWLNLSQTAELVEKFSNTGFPVIASKRGSAANGGGTWAYHGLVFAYAEWISSEFHKAVIETFSAAVEGKGKKAVKAARSVARVDGVHSRKSFSSGLAKHGADKTFYADMSDVVNLIILGKSSSTMKSELGLKKYKPLRDALPDQSLLALSAVEALAAARLALNPDVRKAMAREITYNSANDVARLLGINQ